ncbi:hypothetical protein PAPYR_4807 [Paratrimastix pyriformis]|uniref:C-type lectin domain-containing protein n=1 Tax=Paratrimastix pyriformis TaxID=342808 RepID=A0ABQ8UMP1_9EUKA|nr:hypothetical protein PAPYR_4807 [Paratrimastix pyriformis]
MVAMKICGLPNGTPCNLTEIAPIIPRLHNPNWPHEHFGPSSLAASGELPFPAPQNTIAAQCPTTSEPPSNSWTPGDLLAVDPSFCSEFNRPLSSSVCFLPRNPNSSSLDGIQHQEIWGAHRLVPQFAFPLLFAEHITIPVPRIWVPSAHFAASFQTLSLGPATLSGYPVGLVHISVSASAGGSVRLDTVPAGLSTADNCVNTYWSTGAPSFCFVGSQADVNTALASLQFYRNGTVASQYAVVIQATPAGAIYFSQNQHYYQLETAASWYQQLCRSEWVYSGGLAAINVATCLPTSGTRTRRTFNGLNGYMATVTSPEENEVVYQVHGSWCWLAATDKSHVGVWTWEAGPEKGTVFWDSSCTAADRHTVCRTTGGWNNWRYDQPDNGAGGTEHHLHQWAAPIWNDYVGTNALVTVVEYGGMGGSPLHEAVTGTIDITLDDSPPVFVAVTIASDHPDGNTNRAWIGDVVTVRCLCDEDLAAAPVVFIGGRPATVTAGSEPRLWLAQITVALTDGEWPMGFEIASATDLAGNSMPSAVVGATTGPSTIDYDYEVIPVSIDTSHAPTAALLVTSRRFIPTPAHLTAPASGCLATLHAAVRAVGGLVRLGSAPPAGVVGPSEGGFSTDWTAAAATLDLEGTPADLDAALASLQFAPLAGQATAQLTVFLVPPEMAFLSTTAHFYNVTDTTANWPQSRCGALWEYPDPVGGTVNTTDCTSSTGRRRHRAWNGLWGYLATATSERENTLLAELVPGHRTAFLGGTDIETEGDWKWVDGPEAGQVFWRWGSCPTGLCGTCTATGRYSCWNTGEPNNSGTESALSINPARGAGTYLFARWNDLPPTTQLHPSLVEYGGALCPSCGGEQRPMHWGQADATFTVDDTPPTVAWAQLASSNPRDTTRATCGHTVTLAITANESLPSPPRAVLLCGGGGDTLALTMTGGPVHFVGSAVVEPAVAVDTSTGSSGSGGGGCWVEGPLGFRVEEMVDWMNYTMASSVTCADPGPCLVTLDFTPPHLTAVAFGSTNPNPGLAKAGDRLTLALTTDEPLYGAPRVSIGGAAHLLVASGALTQWTASVVLGAGDPEGLVGFRIEEGATDAVGNPMNGTALPAATQRTTIRYDRTPPAVLAVSVASNNTVGLGWAALGDAVWVNITANEELLTGPTVHIGTHLATVEWLGGSGGSGGDSGPAIQRFGAWVELDGTDSEGPVGLSVGGCVDLAGNAQTGDATNTTDGSWVILDRTRPMLPVVHLASSTNPDPTWATRGDNATLTFVASEPLVGLPRVTIGHHHSALVLRAANGGAGGGSEEGGWTHFTATARLDATDEEGPVPFVVEGCVDRAGNEMSPPVTATSDASGITFDLTSPTIVRASIASSNGDPALARSGDTVLLEFEASEPLLGPPMVTLAGHVLAPADLTGGPLRFQVALTLGDADPEGLVQVVIAGATDRAGNVQPVPLTNTTDGSAVRFDRTAPRLTAVSLANADPTRPSWAKVGDTVLLRFASPEPLRAAPAVTLGHNHRAVVTALLPEAEGLVFFEASAVLNATDAEGPVPFVIEGCVDLAGNRAAPANATTDGTAVTFGLLIRVAFTETLLILRASRSQNPSFLFPVLRYWSRHLTNPTIIRASIASSNGDPALARSGDTVLLEFEASEPLLGPPMVTLAGHVVLAPADLTGGPSLFQVALTLEDADLEGIVQVAIAGATDRAGNVQPVPLTNTTDGSAVRFDRTAPRLTAVSLANADPTRLAWAKVGDTVLLRFASSEPLHAASVVTVGRNHLSVVVVAALPPVEGLFFYEASAVLDATDAEGPVPFVIEGCVDLAGNRAAPGNATTDGTAVTFDSTPPRLVGVTMRSSNEHDPALARAGDQVTLVMTASEPLLGPPTVTIAGRPVAWVGCLDAGPAANRTWAARLTLDETDPEGPVAFAVEAATDRATNPLAPVPVNLTSDATGVCARVAFPGVGGVFAISPSFLFPSIHPSSFATDRTPPTLVAVSFTSTNDHAPGRLARPGDSLVLNLTASEPLRVPPAARLVLGPADPEGWAGFEVRTGGSGGGSGARDMAGNGLVLPGGPAEEPLVNATAGPSGVTYDRTPPQLHLGSLTTSNRNPSRARPGDTLTALLLASEPLHPATFDLVNATTKATVNATACVAGPPTCTAYTIHCTANITTCTAFAPCTNSTTNSSSSSSATTTGSNTTCPTNGTATPVCTAYSTSCAAYSTQCTAYLPSCTANVTIGWRPAALRALNATAWEARLVMRSADEEGLVAGVTVGGAPRDEAGNPCGELLPGHTAVVFDRTPPVPTDITLSSSNAIPWVAFPGDVLTLRFAVSEPLHGGELVVTVAGHPVVAVPVQVDPSDQFSSPSANDTASALPSALRFEAAYRPTLAADQPGPLGFAISTLEDLAGNTLEGPVSNATLGPSLVYFVPPVFRCTTDVECQSAGDMEAHCLPTVETLAGVPTTVWQCHCVRGVPSGATCLVPIPTPAPTPTATVTPHPPTRFDWLLYVGTPIGSLFLLFLVLLCFLLVLFVARRRKKEKEKEKAPPDPLVFRLNPLGPWAPKMVLVHPLPSQPGLSPPPYSLGTSAGALMSATNEDPIRPSVSPPSPPCLLPDRQSGVPQTVPTASTATTTDTTTTAATLAPPSVAVAVLALSEVTCPASPPSADHADFFASRSRVRQPPPGHRRVRRPPMPLMAAADPQGGGGGGLSAAGLVTRPGAAMFDLELPRTRFPPVRRHATRKLMTTLSPHDDDLQELGMANRTTRPQSRPGSSRSVTKPPGLTNISVHHLSPPLVSFVRCPESVEDNRMLAVFSEEAFHAPQNATTAQCPTTYSEPFPSDSWALGDLLAVDPSFCSNFNDPISGSSVLPSVSDDGCDDSAIFFSKPPISTPNAAATITTPVSSIRVPSAHFSGAFASVSLGSATISGYPTGNVHVTVTATGGQVRLGDTTLTGLSTVEGCSVAPWTTGAPGFCFVGTQANANTALASLQFRAAAGTDGSQYRITIYATPPGAGFLPTTSHYYQYDSTASSFYRQLCQAQYTYTGTGGFDGTTCATSGATTRSARTFNGLAGYMATVTSAEEQLLLTALTDGSTYYWMAGSDDGHQGSWTWMAGPEVGRVFWDSRCRAVDRQRVCGGTQMYNQWDDAQPDGTTHFLHYGPARSAWSGMTEVTALSMVVEYGGAGGTATIPVATGTIDITLDDSPPVFVAVTMTSTNADPTKAREGDVVTVHCQSDEDLAAAPVVYIGGRPATVTGGGPRLWLAQITVALTDGEWPMGFEIASGTSDVLGHATTRPTVNATSGPSTILYDHIPAVITIPVPRIWVPSAHFAASFRTLSLGPATLSGYPVGLVHISVSASAGGSVRLDTVPAGLSTADNCADTYWSTGAPSLCFVGSQADVNTALASLQFYRNGTGASQYSVVIQATPAGAIYFSQNQHYYQLETAASWYQQLCRSEWVYSGGLTAINVATCLPTSGTRTRRTFNGLNGYMATVTSPEENEVVLQLHNDGSWCWLAATDQSHEGVWTWEAGPEKGTVFWNSSCTAADRHTVCRATGGWNNWLDNQPDNGGGGTEDHLHQWASPYWNDYVGTNALATVVEYGGMGGSPLHEAVTGTIDITLDDNPPVFVAVTIASDHPDGNASRAWIGDVVTVRCLCDEDLAAAPVVFIGGRPATVTAGSEPRLWLAQITVALTDGEWPMGFEIASATDLAGNSLPSAVVGATTGPSTIDYDYEVIPVSIDTSHAPTAALLVTSRRFIPTPAHLTAPASGCLATLHAAVRAVGGLVRLGSAPPAGVVGPSEGGFSTDWTAAAATLDLEGTPADLDAALASLQFAPLAGQATAQLTVFLVPPEMAFLSTTAHFYNVTDTTANWPQSRCGALWEYPDPVGGTVNTTDCTSSTGRRRHRAWNGLWGYLATATSERENTLLAELVPGHRTAFLGGTDIETEGDWKWVDGPEAGQVFWRWGSCPTGLCGTCTATGRYSCWNTGEPNNSGTESALNINPTRSGVIMLARWNDLPPARLLPSLVEYGGALCPSCGEQRPMHWGQADATFTVDDTPPTVAWAQLASSNPRDTTRATRGHTVTLSITANESLPNPPRAVLLCGDGGGGGIDGTLALTMTGGPVHFVGSAVVVPDSGGGSGGGGGCWVEGPLGFRVEEMVDWMNYTMASPVTCADPGPCLVTLDFTPPHLTAVAFGSTNPNPGLAKAGDRLTLTLTTDEPLYGAPWVSIGGSAHLLVASGALTQWTASVVLGAGDPEGLVGFRIEEGAADAAGNPMNGTALPAATQRTTIRYDRTPPAILAISVASNNTVGLGWAALGDAVWVNITASEELLTGPTVRIGTHLATVEWLGGGGGGGTAGQRFGAWAVLDETDSEGVPVVVSVGGCVDLAGNAQTADVTNTTDGSWLILDRTRPTLPVVHLASSTNPDPAWATRGDNATLSFVASEPLVGLPRITIGHHHPALVLRAAALPGGANRSAGSEEGGWTHFTATARLDATDEEGPVPFVVEGCVDRAGNEMSPPVTVTSDASGITFDLTSPTIVRASIASSNGDPALARSGDTVLLEFEASEPLLGPPRVALAGHVVLAPADLTGGPSLFQVALTLGDVDPEGLVQVVIAGATDRAGNVQLVPLFNTTDGSAVRFDRTAPRLTAVSFANADPTRPSWAKVGDTVLLRFASSEPLRAAPAVTVGHNHRAVVTTLPPEAEGLVFFEASAVLNATDAEGPVPFVIEGCVDLAGNRAAPANATTDWTAVIFGLLIRATSPASCFPRASRSHKTLLLTDMTPPRLVGVTMRSTNEYDPALARAGDEGTVVLTASEPLLGPPTVTIAGRPAAWVGCLDAGPAANRTWAARLTLNETDPEGPVAFAVEAATDRATNPLAPVPVNLTSDATGVWFDRTPPTLVAVIFASTNDHAPDRLARPGDSLVLNLTASEPLRVPPAVLLAGRPANLTGGPIAWQARLVLGPADPEGWVGFEVRTGGSGGSGGARDMAGNGLVLPGGPAEEPLVNATAGPSGVTYDRTPPQLRLGSLTTSNRNPTRARPGDTLTALLLASEPLHPATFDLANTNATACVAGPPTCTAYTIHCTANITTCTAFAPCTNSTTNSSSSSSATTTGSNTTCPTNGTATTPVCTAYSTSCAAYSTQCTAYLPSCTANVTIGGRLAALWALNATAWEARLVMGPADEEGLVAGVTVGGAPRDEAGNPYVELLPGHTAVVFDRTPPVPTDVTMSSSNAIPRVALPGDVLTLRFAVSEPLRGGELVVTVAGHPVVAVPVQEDAPDPSDPSSSPSANASNSALPLAIRFEAAYRPTLAADRPGPLGFAISTLEDLAGNTLEGPVSNATLGPSLVYFGSNCTLDADCTRVTGNATCVATVPGVWPPTIPMSDGIPISNAAHGGDDAVSDTNRTLPLSVLSAIALAAAEGTCTADGDCQHGGTCSGCAVLGPPPILPSSYHWQCHSAAE